MFTFETLVAAIAALGLKWKFNAVGRLTCERGDCAVGAYMRATLAENEFVAQRIASGEPLNPLVGAAEKNGLQAERLAIIRVINANDGPHGIYSASGESKYNAEDRAYLLNALQPNGVDPTRA